MICRLLRQCVVLKHPVHGRGKIGANWNNVHPIPSAKAYNAITSAPVIGHLVQGLDVLEQKKSELVT